MLTFRGEKQPLVKLTKSVPPYVMIFDGAFIASFRSKEKLCGFQFWTATCYSCRGSCLEISDAAINLHEVTKQT